MLVCFIGFYQLEQSDTLEYNPIHSLKATDCVFNYVKIQKIKYLKIKMLIAKQKSNYQLLLVTFFKSMIWLYIEYLRSKIILYSCGRATQFCYLCSISYHIIWDMSLFLWKHSRYNDHSIIRECVWCQTHCLQNQILLISSFQMSCRVKAFLILSDAHRNFNAMQCRQTPCCSIICTFQSHLSAISPLLGSHAPSSAIL